MENVNSVERNTVILSRSFFMLIFPGLITRVGRLLHTARLSFQFGFVQCHSYLDSNQLGKIKMLLECKDNHEKQKVLTDYEHKFASLVGHGFSNSFASARMAFYTVMKALGIRDGDEVVLTAFTCSVMPNAVMMLGARPVYADMDRNTFGSSAESIQKVLTERTRLIVAQHSFGIPCDIQPIIELAKSRGIYVVEDCAITLGSAINGVAVGNWGDAAIFSTDHSKPINTMIGGILYTKDEQLHKHVANIAKSAPALSGSHQRNLYGQLLFERKHYEPTRYPRAKFFHYLRKLKVGLFGEHGVTFLEDNYKSIVSLNEKYPYPAAMPAFLAMLGLYEIERWKQQITRRKTLLASYIEILKQSGYGDLLPLIYNDKSRNIIPLRLVFSSKESNEIIQKVKDLIDIDWIWFRQPIVGAVDGMSSLGYIEKSCPVAEDICSSIVNFPCNVNDEAKQVLLNALALRLRVNE